MEHSARPRPGPSPQRARRVPAVERAVRILQALAAAELRLTEIARTLDLPKSTTLALAETLAAHGLVAYDPGPRRYRLGAALAALGGAVQAQSNVRRAARPHLERLVRQTGETAILHVPDGTGSVILDREESPHQLRVTAPLGMRLPPFAGAVAKVFLAALPEREAARLVGRTLPAFTPRSITRPDAYLREVRRVRRQGFARDDQEYLCGVRAVSAPISASGRVVASLSVVGVAGRLDGTSLRAAATLVHDAAAAVTAELSPVAPGNRVHPSGDGARPSSRRRRRG